MSGTRAITLTLSVQNAAKLQEDLKALGTAGEEALRRLDAAVKKPGQGAKEASDNFGGMTQRLQSAGYQVQDFAVQVQGGTSALTALSQQASQFLGTFGTGGAIAGAVLTVGLLATQILSTAASVADITKANEAWQKSQADINSLLESGIEKLQRLGREQRANTAAPVRAAEQTAMANRDLARQEVADLERLLAEARGGEGRRPAGANVIRDFEVALASRRDDLATAERQANDARATLQGIAASEYGPPASAAAQTADPAARAIREGEDRIRAARRTRGLDGPALAIEQARIRGEAEADRVTNDPAQREIIVQNAITEARLQTEAATSKLGETEAKRFASAMQSSETEINRSRDALEMSRALAAAVTPQAAAEAQRRFEIERTTAALRAQAAATTDPAIAAGLRRNIDLIRLMRTEAVGNQERIANNAALFQQAQAAGNQGAQRRAAGMLPDESSRFLGEFAEKQRIDADGRLQGDSPEALERIRRAGELAFGDEQMRQLRTFTNEVRNIGGAFTDAFSAVAFEGAKVGDTIASLEKQVAAMVYRATVGAMLTKAINAGANALGSSISSYFSPGATSDGFGTYSAAIGPTISGAPMAMGGVMTDLGPLPLQKYAGGGVARAPQVAIFGENRQPEAYVPLPDGRTIPVTMAGASGGTTISIDARGAELGVEQRIDAVLARRMPAIVAASRLDLASRVNLGGSAARTFGRA